MSFLYPGVLWALPLVGLPVLIHLLNRQRYQRVEFGAMEFLRRAIKRTRRRVLLEDVLLLALRTLAVLLLILGLAGPTLGPDSLLGTRAPRAEVVVLDRSLSMNRRVDGVSADERARAAIRELLEDLDPVRGDRAALILAGPRAERPAYGDPAEVRLAVDELDEAPAGSAALAGALETARRTAETLENESGLAPTVRIYSDLQASSWDLDGPLGEAIVRLGAEGRPVELFHVGQEGPNTAVLDLQLAPARLTSGGASEVRATIRRFGDAQSVRASLLLDGDPVRTERLELGADEEFVFRHLLQPARSGARAVSLELEADELVGDDARHGILRVADALPARVVGRAAAGEDADGIYEALVRYLDLGPTGPLVVDTSEVGALRPERVRDLGLILLADPGPLDGLAVETLRDFVEGGGGLLVVAGPRTGQSAVEALLLELGAQGVELDAPIDSDADGARLVILDPDHPALELFDDPRWRPLLTEVPHLRYRPIRTPAERPDLRRAVRFARSDDAELALGDALLDWQHEAGHVALLTAAPLPAWNLMDQVPGGTLPFLLDLAMSLAPRPGHTAVLTVGEALEVELPGAPTAVTVLAPDGRRTTPADPAEPLPGGRTILRPLRQALLPGVWAVEADLLEGDGLERRHVERVAVNPPASESDPTEADLAAIQAALPDGSRLHESGDAEITVDGGNAGEARLAELLLALMAACILGETLLAAILDRRRG